MQDARPSPGKPRRMIAECRPTATRFDADHSDVLVPNKVEEQANRIAPSTNAGDERSRKAAFLLQNLRADFASDDGLEVANHKRIRMRTKNRAEHVIRCAHIRNPVANGFIDGVLERPASRRYGHHARAQQFHAEDVDLLPADVLLAHVDVAW